MRIKKMLRRAFTPPEPQNKDEFLKSLCCFRMTYFEFILSQICYIRKRVWIFSMILLLLSLSAVCVIPRGDAYAVWIISAFVPFLALLTAAEISRSNLFGISEIEAACRFSLPQLTGARMIILGICNFAVISVIVISFDLFSPVGIMKAALYILTPYITVNGISLAILNRISGPDGVYISVAAAMGVSLAGVLSLSRIVIDLRFVNNVRGALCVIGAIVTALQMKKMMTGKDNLYGIKN